MPSRVPKTVKLDTGMAQRILGIGVPSAFENSLFEAGRIVVVSMISTFGTVQIAANAVANNLDGVGCIPGKAISLAMITVVGRCIGAGDNEQAVYYSTEAAGLGLPRHGCAERPHPHLRPASGGHLRAFGRDDGAFHHPGLHPRGLCNAALAALLRAAQRPARRQRRQVHDDRLHRQHGLLAVGFSYIIGVRMGMGAIGVWIAMVVDWVCRVTCFVTRFRSGVWKEKYQA